VKKIGLSTDVLPTDNTLLKQTIKAKSLTNQGVFGVIVGFPDRSISRRANNKPKPFNQASQSTAAECRIPPSVGVAWLEFFQTCFSQFQDRP
jgi:hypothetical protein